MKVLLYFLISSFLLLSALSAYSLSSFSSGRISLAGDGYSASFEKDRMVVKTAVFSFGSVSDGGIIRMLDSPYSSSSVVPSFSLSSQSSVTGAALHLSFFTLFSFYGMRNGVGFSYEGNFFDATLMYASAAEDDSFQKDRLRRIDSSAVWAAFSYQRKGLLEITFLASLNGEGSFSSLFNLSLSSSSISASYGMGRVQGFLDKGKPWYSSLSFSLDEEHFEVEHRIYLARSPVYLREYRDYEYRVNGRLKLGDFVFSDTITKTFLSGKTEREEKISLSWNAVTIGYKRSTDSFYAAVEKDGVNAVWEDGKLTVLLTHSFSRGDFTFNLNFTSEGTVSWAVTYGSTSL